MTNLKDKAISIQGKSYVLVKDRILYLAENFAGKYSVQTGYDYYPDRKMWVVRATLTLNGQTYTGLAQEVESDNYKDVNHTSALENCETSSIGRACAMAGIGVLDSIASADEIHKAQNRAVPVKQHDYVFNGFGYKSGEKNGRKWYRRTELETGVIEWLQENQYYADLKLINDTKTSEATNLINTLQNGGDK